ncbi:MAG: MFS transporter [Kiritimatiellia bacterium]
MEKSSRSFIPLFATNFFGVVNDNFLKTLASFVVIGWMADSPRTQSVFMGVTAGALVLPYILFSPLADRLTVLFEKTRIFRFAKWAELPIMAVASAGLLLRSPALVVASVLLMGLQSALYSPAKYALVRDIGGEGRISTGMGGMEGIAFLAVLGGTIAASFAADLPKRWEWVHEACLFGFAALGLLFSYTIRADEERSRAVHAINPVRYLRRAHRMLGKYPGLNAVIYTLSTFWWAAATLQMGLLIYGKQVLGLDSTHTGMLLAGAAVGIVAGQVIAGFVDRRRFLLGATLLTGWLAAALLLVLFFAPLSAPLFSVGVAVLAFDLGFFKLPLDAEIQKVVKGPRLNTALAYFNQVSFLFMLAASGCYALLGCAFGPRAFLLVLALAFLVVPLAFVFSYRSVFCVTGRWIFRRRYAVDARGLEAFRPGVTYLVLPNHPAMVDPMLVTAELWRTPVKPLVDELFLDRGGVSGLALRTLGAVRVPDLRKNRSEAGAKIARGLTGVVTDALAAGHSVIFYPSGHIWTEPREEIGTRQLAYNVCKELPPNVRVVCVRTEGLWGSIWSRKGRSASPSFGPTLLKSTLLWLVVLVTFRRRKVTMTFEDMTDRVREWAGTSPRLAFNRRLETWYNRLDAPVEPGVDEAAGNGDSARK